MSDDQTTPAATALFPETSHTDAEQLFSSWLDARPEPEQETAAAGWFQPDPALQDDGLIHESPDQRQLALDEARQQGVLEGMAQARVSMEAELRQQIHQEIHDKSRAEGHQHGHEAGYQAGLEQARPKIDRQLALLAELNEQITVWQNAQQSEQLQQLREVICTLTSEVVMAELKLSPNTIHHAILAALNVLPESHDTPLITLNPADKDIVESFRAQLKANWTVHEAPQIHPGGCRVETAQSDIDSTLERRLEQVQNLVREVFNDRP